MHGTGEDRRVSADEEGGRPAAAGTLYVVATPIGNLEDVTLRALRILGEVDLIAAEDTRHTRKLLSRYDIHTPTTSYHQHSRPAKALELVSSLREGKSLALVSDAGTPGVSDPGEELVRLALDAGARVEIVPGPSVVLSALAVSGLPTGSFRCVGFLPRRREARRRALAELKDATDTLVLFEAPHRLVAALRDILAEFGDRRLAVARELTKVHEEVLRCRASEALQTFEAREPRGEITLVIEGSQATSAQDQEAADPEGFIASRLVEGASVAEAARAAAAELGMRRREAYAIAVRLRDRNEAEA
jgi:16S rRNA (cytidine1402-2'-O)-methyltransferase